VENPFLYRVEVKTRMKKQGCEDMLKNGVIFSIFNIFSKMKRNKEGERKRNIFYCVFFEKNRKRS